MANQNSFEISTPDENKRPIGDCFHEMAGILWTANVKGPVQEFLARKDVHQVNTTYALNRNADTAMFDAYADA